MKLNITTSIFFVFFTSCITAQQINKDITRDELYNHINFLASDALKGRFPGTNEDKLAARYIAKQFNISGLELLYSEGLQEFETMPTLTVGENNSLIFNNVNLSLKTDFSPYPFSVNNELESEIVFVGYGFNIKNDSTNWNDFTGIDISGKWALILLGTPDSKSSLYEAYGSARSKAIAAEDHGAAGVIFVSGLSFNKTDNLVEIDKPQGQINIPVVQIKRKLADKILQKTNNMISDLEFKLNTSKKSISFNTNEKIKIRTDIQEIKNRTFNIVSTLLVDSSKMANYIVIGAHYDHLGLGGIGTGSRNPNVSAVHYGADDNASGVAALLEIAQKLESMKGQLKTNFIFVAFGAEEMGLLGSKYFTNNLPVNKSQIKAMINIDMVGRMKKDNSLQIGGIGTTIINDSIVNMLNSNYNFQLGLSKEGYGPSDHSSFYSINIPVFFFSTGPHTDYHTPGDSIGNINFDGMEKVSNYIFDLAVDLANTKSPLTFTEAGPKAPTNTLGDRKMKVTLGIMPDFSGVEKRGLRVDLVIDGKAADKSGMKTGDIIVAIDGLVVKDIYGYMDRLAKLSPGQIITIEVIRENENKVLIVQL